MYDFILVKEIIDQIIQSLELINERFSTIHSPDDFIDSPEGKMLFDSICMQLITIGESLKNIDKITNYILLQKYQDIDWKGIKGLRDIISHHYFDIDHELIFQICKNNIYPLMNILKLISSDISNESSF